LRRGARAASIGLPSFLSGRKPRISSRRLSPLAHFGGRGLFYLQRNMFLLLLSSRDGMVLPQVSPRTRTILPQASRPGVFTYPDLDFLFATYKATFPISAPLRYLLPCTHALLSHRVICPTLRSPCGREQLHGSREAIVRLLELSLSSSLPL
jgi:hypothetical protein